MAIGKPRRRTVDSPMIHSRTRCELTLVVILSVLTIFLFPSMQDPYSVVRGPATAFRAARSAAIAHASIVQGAMHSIRNSPGSPPRLAIPAAGIFLKRIVEIGVGAQCAKKRRRHF